MFFGVADSLRKALAEYERDRQREMEAVARGCAYCGEQRCGCGAEEYHPAHPHHRPPQPRRRRR